MLSMDLGLLANQFHEALYLTVFNSGMSRLASNLHRLASKWKNLRFFKISFSTFWLTEPKCTETDLKKSQIFLIWGTNLT